MKCPNCESEEPDYVIYCGKCGGSMKESEQSAGGPEKDDSSAQMAPSSPMTEKSDESPETSSYLTGDLEDVVAWWADPGSDGQAGVSLEGTIQNIGTEDMVAIVHIRVFDGNNWRNFTANAGVVPAGGQVDFGWDQGLGQVDDNAVRVEYDISRGQGNESAVVEPPPPEVQKDRKKTRRWEWHWEKRIG